MDLNSADSTGFYLSKHIFFVINKEKQKGGENKKMISNLELLNSKREFLKSTNLVSMPNITLNPSEADAFIDLMVEESYFLKNCRIEKMTMNEKNIRMINFNTSKRIMRPSDQFSSADYIKTLSEGKITLSAKKARGCAVIFDDDLDDDVEGAKYADTIMNLIAKQVSTELSEAIYVANTISTGFAATDWRHSFNGFRYDLLNFSADSGTIPTASHELSAASTGDFTVAGNIAEYSSGENYNIEVKFGKMLATLPNKYKGDYKNLRYYTSPTILADYTQKLQSRNTPLGDNALIGVAPTTYADIPIVPVSQMPVTFATGSAGTEEHNENVANGTYKFGDCFLTNKNNLVVGIHRSLRLERERSAADEADYFFFSIRMDTMIQNPDACVMLHDITNG